MEKEAEVKELKTEKAVDKVISIRVASAMGIAAAVFWIITTAYSNFITPNENNEDAIVLLKAQVENQQSTIATITKTQQNDTQELRDNIKDLEGKIGVMTNSITALTTIIDERIPKK